MQAADGSTARIEALLVSPVHRWSGRPEAEVALGSDDTVEQIEVRAGLGIVGDRYFNAPSARDASVTVLAAESLDPYPGVGLARLRRNVLLRGVDVDAAVGPPRNLDSGDGPVVLALRRPARPCGWLDLAVAPGARKALLRHAGVRCEPLTDGVLRVGPVAVSWADV